MHTIFATGWIALLLNSPPLHAQIASDRGLEAACLPTAYGNAVYALDVMQGSDAHISRIAPSPVPVTSFSEAGISDDASDLAIDSRGNFYLLFIHSPPEPQDPVIRMLSRSGQTLRSVSSEGSPDAIAVGPNDELYVADIEEDESIRITRLLPSVAPVTFVEATGVSEDGVDFSVDAAGNYYLLAGDGRIRTFASNGQPLPDISASGSPDALAVGPRNSLYAVDTTQGRSALIERLTPDRAGIASFDDAAISDDGVSLVVDAAGNASLLFSHSPPQPDDPVVRRFAPDGTCFEDLDVDGTPDTLALGPPCTGDCDGDGLVTVGELIKGVSISLDRPMFPLSTCPSLDLDANDRVTVNELVTAVRRLLLGCF